MNVQRGEPSITDGARPVFLAIVGPTASGKTDLSLSIARRVPTEIVSMDSRQVYRGMDVGTDKVSHAARAEVPHHGLDVVAPDDRYSAGRFARDARHWIAEIQGRGCLPILAGGTGFFLRAVTEPIFAEPPLNPNRLEALRAYLATQDRDRLEQWVRALDPTRADVAVQGGPQRMGRTLEIALLSGRPLSWWHEKAPAEADGLPALTVLLDIPREEMDMRISERVDGMVDRGLVAEVQGLLDRFGEDAPGMTGTGYRELLPHLRGEISLDEALEEVKLNTRRYARRQLTWYRHQLPDPVLRVDATAPVDEQTDQVLDAWERAGGSVPRREHANEGVGT